MGQGSSPAGVPGTPSRLPQSIKTLRSFGLCEVHLPMMIIFNKTTEKIKKHSLIHFETRVDPPYMSKNNIFMTNNCFPK